MRYATQQELVQTVLEDYHPLFDFIRKRDGLPLPPADDAPCMYIHHTRSYIKATYLLGSFLLSYKLLP